MGGGNLHRTPAAGVSRSVRSYALALCMAFAIAAVPVQAQVKNITLKASNTPVSTVMQQIEEQSGYTFFYNTKDIPLDRNVTLSVANKDIRAALDELFRNTNVSYSIDNKSIILSARGGAQPQQASQITGRIVDKNGVPVIGATIMISGTTQGTTSGVDGTFALQSNVSPAGMVLDVSFIGYKPQRISVNNRTSLSVTLEEDDQQIEAVVVTALGIKRQERAVSYNVQNISDEVFLTRDANMVNSLAGKIAGVTINASAAGVGGETKVVMRGSKSIAGSNNALYVLDGIPLPSLSLTNPGDEFTIMRENNLTGDGISNFNLDDIASMAALTGPSAAALYGSQAANGVLMLTTRSGEEGVSVNYSNNTTFMSPFLTPAFQNTYGAKDGYYASWGSKLVTKQSWTPTDFYQTGYNTSNSVGLSFGGKKSQTYVSAGVVTAEGIIPNNEYNRYNFTANHSSSFLDERMHLSVLGMYMNVNEQNMLSSGQYYNPMIPVYLMSPSDDIRKYAVYERYNASRNFPVQYWPWGSQSLQMQNPYWITNRNMFNTGKDRFLFGASLKYDVTDWLDITGRARIDYTHITAEQKNYASTLGLFAGDKGRYYNNTYITSQRYADVLANFHKTFADGAFSLNATLGASIEDYKHRAILLGGDLTGVPNLFTLANMTTNKSQAKETINDQTQSLFATLQLGYKNMVFLDVTARNDWVTALANTSKTSMFYPSVGLSAVLTDIFKVDSRVLSFAKIRASYAEVGNAPMRWITIPTYPVSHAADIDLPHLGRLQTRTHQIVGGRRRRPSVGQQTHTQRNLLQFAHLQSGFQPRHLIDIDLQQPLRQRRPRGQQGRRGVGRAEPEPRSREVVFEPRLLAQPQQGGRHARLLQTVERHGDFAGFDGHGRYDGRQDGAARRRPDRRHLRQYAQDRRARRNLGIAHRQQRRPGQGHMDIRRQQQSELHAFVAQRIQLERSLAGLHVQRPRRRRRRIAHAGRDGLLRRLGTHGHGPSERRRARKRPAHSGRKLLPDHRRQRCRRHRRLLCLLDDQRPAGRADPRLRHPRPEVVQVDQGTQRLVHRPQPLDALLQSAVRSRNGRRHGHLLVRHRLLHAAEYAQPRILGKSDLLTSTLQSYEKS